MKKTILLCILLMTSVFNLSCSSDNDSNVNNGNPNGNEPSEELVAKEYKLQIWGTSSPEQQYPLHLTYYKDNNEGDLITETVNSLTNTDVIESKTISIYNKIGFKYDVNDNNETLVSGVVITDVETNDVVFEKYDLVIEKNKTFMYKVSSDSYIIEQ